MKKVLIGLAVFMFVSRGMGQILSDSTANDKLEHLMHSIRSQYLVPCFAEWGVNIPDKYGNTIQACSMETVLFWADVNLTDSIRPLALLSKNISEYYNRNGVHILFTGGYQLYHPQRMLQQATYGKVIFINAYSCVVSEALTTITDSFNAVTHRYLQNITLEFNFDSTRIYFKHHQIIPYLTKDNKAFAYNEYITTKSDTFSLDRFFAYSNQRTDSASFNLQEELFTMLNKGLGTIIFRGKKINGHYHKNMKKRRGMGHKKVYYFDHDTHQHFLTRILSQKMVSVKYPNL